MNLREQFNADTKGYASFQEYCRARHVRQVPNGMQVVWGGMASPMG